MVDILRIDMGFAFDHQGQHNYTCIASMQVQSKYSYRSPDLVVVLTIKLAPFKTRAWSTYMCLQYE